MKLFFYLFLQCMIVSSWMIYHSRNLRFTTFLWISYALLLKSFSQIHQFQNRKVFVVSLLFQKFKWNPLFDLVTVSMFMRADCFCFAGIYWDKLSPEKLQQIRILRELKKRLEKKTGVKLPTGPSEKLPPTAERKRR